MVELVLNLIWFAVATLLCVAVCRNPAGRVDGRVKWAALVISIVCVAAVVFPAISVSDDLHAPYILSESPEKRIVKAVADQPLNAFALLLMLVLIAACFLEKTRRINDKLVPKPIDGFTPALAGRAPPRFSF
jgi:heme A synthase